MSRRYSPGHWVVALGLTLFFMAGGIWFSLNADRFWIQGRSLLASGFTARSGEPDRPKNTAPLKDKTESCLDKSQGTKPLFLIEEEIDTYFLKGLAPVVESESRDPTTPLSMELRRGVATTVYDVPRADRDVLDPLVRELFDYGKGKIVLRSPWVMIWPTLRSCFGDRPVLYLNYNRAPGPFDTGPGSIGYINTSLPVPGNRLTATGVYIIPPAKTEKDAWLINTSPWPPDQKTLSLGICCASSYSRTGETLVMRLENSEALKEIGRLLEQKNADLPNGYPNEITETLELADQFLAQGDIEAAAKHLEEAMIIANAKGLTIWLQRDPEFRLRLAKTQMQESPERALNMLLDASYRAEELGREDLLNEVLRLARPLVVKRTPNDILESPVSMAFRVLLRLVEINPFEHDIWMSLAANILSEYTPPTAAIPTGKGFEVPGPIAIAEAALTLADKISTTKALDRESSMADAALHSHLAGIYLRSLPASVPISGPVANKIWRQIDAGLRINPNDPYGFFLQGLISANQKDWLSAAAWMDSASRVGETMPEAEHAATLYRALSQGVPEPWRQAVFTLKGEEEPTLRPKPVWSPGGRYVAMALTYRTLDGQKSEIAVYDLEANSKSLISPGERFQELEVIGWSTDSRWLYLQSAQGGGVWRTTPDGGEIIPLAPRGYQATLNPERSAIAYVDRGAIFVLRLSQGESPRRLTLSKNPASFPVWSPDGKEIIYVSSEPSGINSIRRVNVAKPTGEVNLVTCQCIIQNPSWVVPGEVLGSETREGGRVSYKLLNLSGNIHPLPDPSNSKNLYLWAPSRGEVLLAYGNSLILLGPDGVPVLQKRIAGLGNRPVFSSLHNITLTQDGSTAVYTYELPGATGIWLSPIEGKGLTLLGLTDKDSSLSVSPDGKLLAVAGKGFSVSIFRIP